MNLSRPFIERPVMTTVLMAALVIFGLFAYRSLPVSELPDVDFPTIVVTASLPGASPQTMANSVATPLEQQFSGVSGIDSMVSTSSTGSTRITLQFDLSRNIDSAAQDVQTAISEASRHLPSQMPALPTLRKVNPADSAILYIALSSRHLPLTRLDEYAQTRIADRVSMLPGVAQVLVFGAQKYAVRIELDPYALQARGLTLGQVASAVRDGNSNVPSGTLEGARRAYTVSSDGQLSHAADYNDLIVAYRNGAPVYLRNVGRAVDSVANDRQLTRFNGRPAIVLAVKRQPGANTVDVVRRVRALLPELQDQAPGDTRFDVLYDRSAFIKASVHEVTYTLLLAAALVVVVILLFLRNISATVISALSLPTSLIGTFAVMYLLGFSIDTLSLMALTLAVGFVVDDAIVVQENIVRYLEHGHGRRQAALMGSREIGFTVVSMTLSLIAVFIPILFMGGILGRLFTEFAATLGIAVGISGCVALTLTPMLASRYLGAGGGHGRAWRALERVFDAALSIYGRALRVSVRHWPSTLAVALLILVASGYLFWLVPKGFIPSQDSGLIIGSTRAPEGITFAELKALQEKAAAIVRHNPNVLNVMSSVGQGAGGSQGSNIGRLIIHLKPRSEGRAGARAVIQQLRRALRPVEGLQTFFRNPPAIRIGAYASNASYQYVLQGPDYASLAGAAEKLEAALRRLQGVRDVNSDLQLDNPQVNVHIRRDRASSLGISAKSVQQTLYDAYGQSPISTIYGAADSYDVLMQLAPRYQRNINALDALSLRGANGQLVPLPVVADISSGVGPLSVTHYGQLPSVTLSFNLAPGASLGQITSEVGRVAAQVLPADITGTFAGSARAFQASMRSLPLLLLFTVAVIYMVLAILYEHFVLPVTILTALPLAGFGALLTLLLFHEQLNIYSFAGLILLVGLVKKNGIIMVDFALQMRREQGLSPADAIIEACRVRFRPIMMTTLAAIFGTLPLALGVGAGAESRRALGLAVVGGLVFSQMLTLFVTPAFYVAMEHASERLKGRRSRPA